MRRLLAHIEQSRNARLHFERHLVLRDARLQFRIMQRSIRDLVQRVDGLYRVSLHVTADAARIRDVQNRIADRVEPYALELTGQNAGRPLPRRDRLHLTAVALRHEHDKTGEIVGL
jgi:hypothetical protein